MDFVLRLFVGLSLFLVWYILSKNRGVAKSMATLWIAIGFGAAGILLSVILENIFLPSEVLTSGALHGDQLTKTALIVGVVEELSKFLPLAIFIYKKGYFSTYNDGLLYFAVAGVGFGLPENIMYTAAGGALVGAVRLIMTPFFHAATTALAGYFLVRDKIRHRGIEGATLAVAAVIGLHAAYDYGLLSGEVPLVLMSIGITLSMTALLFVLVSIARKNDDKIASKGLNGAMRAGALSLVASGVDSLRTPGYAQGASVPNGLLTQNNEITVPSRRGEAAAVTALILGVLSIVISFIPIIGQIPALAAIIMGAVLYRRYKSIVIGAIITGSIGLFLGVVWFGGFLFLASRL